MSVHNHCVIDLFGGVFVSWLCLSCSVFSVSLRDFVIRFNQISSLLSLKYLPEIWPPMRARYYRRTRHLGRGSCRRPCSACSTGSSSHTNRWPACYCCTAWHSRCTVCLRTRIVAGPRIVAFPPCWQWHIYSLQGVHLEFSLGCKRD